MKIKKNLLYIIFIYLIVEITLYLSTIILKNSIVFKSGYILPENYTTKSFDSELGWAHHDRANPGGEMSCFGGSFTYGTDVKENESWVGLLNENLIKTSNYGVGAYGIDQSYLRAKLNLDNESKVFLLSFIGEAIYRNLTVYRPFSFPNSKTYFTKPRFFTKENEIVFFSNPIKRVEDFSELQSINYLKEIGKKDFFYSDLVENAPKKTFPFLRILFNKSFWYQLNNVFIKKKGPFESEFIGEIWEHPEAIKIQDYILKSFIDDTMNKKKLPILMLLPTRGEIAEYLINEEVSLAVKHTKNFCEKKEVICWFPLFDKALWSESKVESYFTETGHYSVKGNRAIFQYVASQIKKLKQQKTWPD